MRRAKWVVATAAVAVVLLGGAGQAGLISEKQTLTAPYQHELVLWEVRHFMDKWWHRAVNLWPGSGPSQEERQAAVTEYFAISEEVRRLKAELESALALAQGQRLRSASEIDEQAQAARARQRQLGRTVEETLESEITAVLEEMGIINRLGAFRWPPVDFTFEPRFWLLVTSPRDEILRLDNVLLRSGVELREHERIEAAVEELEDLSALVVRVGGIATYPASVAPDLSLHGTLILASHEWLHHHLFFRPLGFRIAAGGGVLSINETVASLAGVEIGDRVFTRLTGQVVERPPYTPPSLERQEEPPPGVFVFRREMRKTRLRVDSLLAEGKVEEAEAYMEARRLLFVENGFPIRKLNQAFFAFNGTYADNPASSSPIEAQLQTVLADSADLDEFLERVAGLTSVAGLEKLARAAGWVPLPASPP